MQQIKMNNKKILSNESNRDKDEMKGSIHTSRNVEPIRWGFKGAMRRMEDEEGTEIEFQVRASLQWRI